MEMTFLDMIFCALYGQTQRLIYEYLAGAALDSLIKGEESILNFGDENFGAL